MNSDDFPSDARLDQLLDSASWPAPDDAQLQRLENHWQNVCDEHQLQKPTHNRWNRHLPWILAAAASLLIGCAIWLTSDRAIKPDESPAPQRIANSVQPKTEKLDFDGNERKGPENNRNKSIVDNTPYISPSNYLNVLAKARDKRLTKAESVVSTERLSLPPHGPSRLGSSRATKNLLDSRCCQHYRRVFCVSLPSRLKLIKSLR